MSSSSGERGPKGEEVAVSSLNPQFRTDRSDFTLPVDADGEVDVDRMNSDQKWWRALSGARKRQTEMEAFAKRYFFKNDNKAQNRFIDKLTFVMSVCAVVLLTYCVSSPDGRAFIPFYFCISCPVLIGIRYFQYKKRKWHYFLLDFCYWANLLCMIYMLAAPESGIFFTIMFAITHSTLPWTIIAYRNSLVFHSIDKFSSFYIHIFPAAVFYALRHYPEDCSRFWYTTFDTNGEEDLAELLGIDGEPNFLILAIGMPLSVFIIFFLQQTFEIFLINVVAKHPCARNVLHVYYDDEYQTLFRYSANSGSGAVYRFINAFGPNHRLTQWLVLNLAFTFFTAIPVYIWYLYKPANAIFDVLCFVWGCWNGANFYIEVFSRRYADRRSVRRPEPLPLADKADAAVAPAADAEEP